ncbi:hypothetical protein HNP37_004648 [Flavobacterium nitrogenifigens]|uniref:DUF3945 domain-containing protein n=2 Tax=Flavobacterium TaxID=237 RepID=A0A7W7J1J0_9FLAO|nr:MULTISPECIES: hypothetical protein [Flavobacterium]MBB4804551.1 hypothetical protein [Flavobacterium nitrogenifigens]MBB6389510.1 hypothetical protein [Flavobacterium notoginsengisoli]
MEQFSNRVEREMLEFKAREERMGILFPSDDVKDSPLLSEKVKHFAYLLSKFKATENPDELYLLKRIQIEKEKLEKVLYPNRFVHLLRKTFHILTAEDRHSASFQKKSLKSREKLFDAVQSAGFKIPREKMLQELESGRDRFTVLVSNYENEKEHMDHQLLFVKDISGGYSFEGFKTSLHYESSSESFREHFFGNVPTSYNTREAYHLLSGRAVEKDGSYIQLDLNDRNAEGSYRIKEFRSDYGFDLKNAIERLPLKDKNADKIDELEKALRNGEAVTAVLEVKEREYSFTLTANPQFKTVDIYDGNLKKINLSALRGRNIKNEKQKTGAAKKNVRQKNKRAVRIQ